MNTVRSFLQRNLILKIGALFVAIIVWKMINDSNTINNPPLPEERTVLKQVPVYVLGRADIQGELILKPDTVDVSVKGTPEGVRLVKATDIRLYVDIAGLRGKARDTRRVQWSIRASGVQIDWTSPSVVEVELRWKTTNSTGKKLFGTDGVRGTANVEPVTAETALKLGRAAAHVFKSRSPEAKGRERHKIVIGKDTRLSGYMIENAIASGILSMGVDVLLIGPLPTPGVAYITRSLRADAGIVLTASHNAYDDNGIKFFRDDGYKLDNEIEREIEEMVFSGKIDDVRPTAAAVGKAFRIDDALGRYIEFGKASFPRGMTLEGFRIAVDVANGAAYKSTPCVLRELGAEVFVYNNAPDGTNINKGCGSTHPQLLRKAVIDHHAHCGIAHDGDADRLIMCDEKAQVVDGDFILAITALDFMNRGALGKNTLVATVQSNLGLDRCLQQAGGKVFRSAVGDKNVIDEMLAQDLNVGGEQSGHMIFRDYTTTGDGLISALQVLRIMKSTGRTLSDLCRCLELFPQVNVAVRVKSKPPLDTLPGVLDLIKEVEAKLGDSGRLLVRYSGTEPLCRVLLEGRDGKQLEAFAQKIANRIRENVGT